MSVVVYPIYIRVARFLWLSTDTVAIVGWTVGKENRVGEIFVWRVKGLEMGR